VVSSSSQVDTVERDVGPLLSQVHDMGSFKAGGLAVSGTRKVASVVSLLTFFIR